MSRKALLCAALGVVASIGATGAEAPLLGPSIGVRLAATLPASGGRLLIFVKSRTNPGENKPDTVDIDIMHPTTVTVIGEDLELLGDSRTHTISPTAQAAPAPIDALPAGSYWVQAVLDRNGTYARRFTRSSGDFYSSVVEMRLPLKESFSLVIDKRIPEESIWSPHDFSADIRSLLAKMRARALDFPVHSNVLSKFAGHPVSLKTWVLVPPDYSPNSHKKWPAVYVLGAYASYHENKNDLSFMAYLAELTDKGVLPPLIWVFPDYATRSGVTEFLDTPNDGPWGTAFTTELIPALEQAFRMDGRSSGRLLWGHSSGGWASIWLQLNYPRLFGGAWATAPDSCDFSNFSGVDLYQPNANIYADNVGRLLPIARENGQPIATMRDWTRAEDTLGHVGGILRSYDYMFSPRSHDGTPEFMFNHVTGSINPAIVSYWKDHYDLARLVSRMPRRATAELSHKLRIVVGTEDTHYLDGS